MKKMKKMMALALAMVMMLAMGVTVFAADTPHSITIKNTNNAISIDGKTYNAYKLFDSTHSGTAYAYYMSTDNQFYSAALVAEEAPAANTLAAVLRTYFDFTVLAGDSSKVSVTPKAGYTAEANAREFADAIQPYLASANADKTGTASGETCTINLDANEAGQGYYIVTGVVEAKDQTTTAGKEEITSAVIITNEDPNPVVAPKAGVPTLNKKITGVAEAGKDGLSTAVNGAVLDDKGVAAVAKVGSKVSYQIDSIVPDLRGYTKYTFIIGDSITAGLDYVKNSFKIKYGTGEATEITPTFKNNDKSFELTIPMTTLDDYTAGTAITLTYDCTVNDSALSYDYENNTANLTYSRNPYNDNEKDTTPDKKTYVIDLNIDVDKVAEGASGKKLDGAEFQLYRMNGSAKEYYKWDATAKKVTWVASGGDTFTTNTAGKLTTQVRGLDKGEYYLEETKAPTGYNALAAPVKVTISVNEANNKVTYSATTDGAAAKVDNGVVDLATAQTSAQPVAVATIVNNAGAELPSTGGIGTTIFYVIGAILVLGAGILLVTRRRMNAN